MPKSLPEGALSLWEKVYNASKEKGDDESTAAQKAWGAVKNAGWTKGDDGKWHKKSLTEFSLNVRKASLDNGKMRWRADTSDIDDDLYNDNMTLQLFSDFVNRIEFGEKAPEEFRSAYWEGGMPYVSVSHYDDMNGAAVPGEVDAVYVDGKFLKAKGTFFDTPLGHKCFESLQQDLQQIKATSKWHDGRVRVSIAFLDYMHRHKSSGYVFERKSLDDVCPECLLEVISGEKKSGKEFLKGLLVHFALTRVPVNTRTIMEVDKSMTTRKEDAASIIGEELADELEEKAKNVKKAVLVEFSDTEETPIEEKAKCEDDKKKEDDMEDDDEEEEKKKEYKAILEILQSLSEKITTLSVAKSVIEPVTSHPLDAAISTLKSAYDNVSRLESTPEDKLRMFQPVFDDFATSVIQSIRPQKSDVVESSKESVDIVQALSAVMQPLADKLELISTKLESRSAQTTVERPVVPARRSIEPAQVQAIQQKATSVTPNLRAIIEKTTR